MDVIGSFLDERCVLDPTAEVTVADLYAAFHEWCLESGERPSSKRAFGMELADRGIQDRRGTGGTRIRMGIDLLAQPDEGQNVMRIGRKGPAGSGTPSRVDIEDGVDDLAVDPEDLE